MSFENFSFVSVVRLSRLFDICLDRLFSQMMYDCPCVCWHILIDGQSAVKISLFVYVKAVFMRRLQFLQQPSLHVC